MTSRSESTVARQVLALGQLAYGAWLVSGPDSRPRTNPEAHVALVR